MHFLNYSQLSNSILWTVFLFTGLLFLSTPNTHADSNPFIQSPTPFAFVANKNPFILLLGVPATENGTLTAAGHQQIRWSANLINNSIRESNGIEAIILDGETYYSLFSFRHGLNENWEVGFDLPLIAHHSGQLDGFIKTWHNALGLSNDRRDIFENNQLQYIYRLNGHTEAAITDNKHGLGDPLLRAALKLSSSHPSRHIALRLSSRLKLGDADKLTGNEGSSFSLALAIDDTFSSLNKNIGLYGLAGYLYLDQGKVLEDMQRKHAGFASLGLNYPLTRQVVLKMQFDFQSSFYQSDLATLGEEALQFTIGGSVQVRPNILLDFGVVENLRTDTTPDVEFYSMLNYAF